MRRVLVTALAVVCTLVASACGDEETSGSSDTKAIEITIANGTVTPNGERVTVKAGQPIELVVKADTQGEIHVHSDPEQTFTYNEGTTRLPFTIDQPGVVDVETHDPDQVVVQLQVE